jgi:hypothetical protein
MYYYVIAPDGQKYGPGDIVTLNQWAAEGRLNATTYVEDASTGVRMPIASVPGIQIVSQQNPYQVPTSYQQYPRGTYGAFDDGSDDVRRAWGFGIAGLLCCPLFLCPAGIYYASNAQRKGNPKAKAALTFNIVALCIGVGLSVVIQMIGSIF